MLNMSTVYLEMFDLNLPKDNARLLERTTLRIDSSLNDVFKAIEESKNWRNIDRKGYFVEKLLFGCPKSITRFNFTRFFIPYFTLLIHCLCVRPKGYRYGNYSND